MSHACGSVWYAVACTFGMTAITSWHHIPFSTKMHALHWFGLCSRFSQALVLIQAWKQCTHKADIPAAPHTLRRVFVQHKSCGWSCVRDDTSDSASCSLLPLQKPLLYRLRTETVHGSFFQQTAELFKAGMRYLHESISHIYMYVYKQNGAEKNV